ncbi:iron ABC transport system substrate-binding protein [Corynebacterium suranareeae]|uniref:Iron ABC transport system substrate-binding protein n=1 Tax=Corynebacterium suranareeae TaxID=2506452 RepID=A0A160PMK4_9CORY|nr:iron-siderophore ABC transporter substrate-binding protein [Corynebacterium suranareeae]BAU94526.1 iron ABC transport system substrate-binding protein [Corynebacterium suranareeae]
MHAVRRRSFAAALLVTLLFVAGCTGANSAAPETDTSENSSGAFPLSVSHAFGKTDIPQKPEKVVTIGWIAHDITAALGVTPVAVSSTSSDAGNGYSPWFEDQVENENNDELPLILTQTSDGPDYEEILALEPDLIFAPHSGVTEVQYERLSEIAPTVPYEQEAWLSGTWQHVTEFAGTVLGESERAEQLIKDTEQTIADAAAEHPRLQGTTIAFGVNLFEGSDQLSFYTSPEDPRVALIHDFGLVDAPGLSELEADGFTSSISLENLNDIDAEVFVAWGKPEQSQRTLDNPVAQRWAPIAEGRYYFTEDSDMTMAMSAPNVLSIPWLIEEGFLDDVEEALDGGAVIRSAP